jgi:hypothetical protein
MEPVEAFRNNDLAYRDWLGHHLDGFVLDCYRHRPQSYVMLHHAAYEKINKPESLSQPEEFTGQQYFKVCSRSPEALVAWASQHGRTHAPDRCAHCGVVVPSSGMAQRDWLPRSVKDLRTLVKGPMLPKRRTWVIVGVVVFVLAGLCFGGVYYNIAKREAEQAAQKREAEQATKRETEQILKSFRSIQAATEVGVTIHDYNKLVIDAKTSFNEHIMSLHDGELKKEIIEIMQSYQDALTVWNDIIGKGVLCDYTSTKYSIVVPKYIREGRGCIGTDKVLQSIWAFALIHLAAGA